MAEAVAPATDSPRVTVPVAAAVAPAVEPPLVTLPVAAAVLPLVEPVKEMEPSNRVLPERELERERENEPLEDDPPPLMEPRL